MVKLERREILTKIIPTLAFGIGIGVVGQRLVDNDEGQTTLHFKPVLNPDDPAFADSFKKFEPLELKEAKNIKEFIEIFDEVFKAFEKRGLVQLLPNQPQSNITGIRKIEFVAFYDEPLLNRKFNLLKGRLFKYDIRTIIVTNTLNSSEEIFGYQIIGDRESSLQDITSEEWLQNSQMLINGFNRNTYIFNSIIEARKKESR